MPSWGPISQLIDKSNERAVLVKAAKLRPGKPEEHGKRSTAPRVQYLDYFPIAETLILICFGLDSSRFDMRTVKAPLRYSA
jgi:hypothetical protein